MEAINKLQGMQGMDKLKEMMSSQNLPRTIVMFIEQGQKEMVEMFIGQADLDADGAGYLAVSLTNVSDMFLVRDSFWKPCDCGPASW